MECRWFANSLYVASLFGGVSKGTEEGALRGEVPNARICDSSLQGRNQDRYHQAHLIRGGFVCSGLGLVNLWWVFVSMEESNF